MSTSNSSTPPGPDARRRRRGERGRRRVGEGHRRRRAIDEIGLGAGRGHGFGVAALLQIALGVGHGIGAVAQRLKALHRLLPGVGLAGAGQRRREVVGRGRVVRLGVDAPPETAATASSNSRCCRSTWPRLTFVGRVGRIDLEHASKRRGGIIDAVVARGRSGPARTSGCGRSGSAATAARASGAAVSEMAAIEQRDREIEMRERQGCASICSACRNDSAAAS